MQIKLRIGGVAVIALLLTSCATPIPLTDAQQQLQNQLAQEQQSCKSYRAQYVNYFSNHVAAMSAGNKQQQQTERERLQTLSEHASLTHLCTRPLCIIEPQQNGTLTSWCGYRYADPLADEVHQWVQWQRVEPN